MRVSIDTAFYKSELLRMSVHVWRTIELRALEIFKAVVDCGGVTRAAAQLHRVPSNITNCLLRRLDKCAAWKELRTTRPKQHHCQHPHELPAFQPTERAQRDRWLFSTCRVVPWESQG